MTISNNLAEIQIDIITAMEIYIVAQVLQIVKMPLSLSNKIAEIQIEIIIAIEIYVVQVLQIVTKNLSISNKLAEIQIGSIIAMEIYIMQVLRIDTKNLSKSNKLAEIQIAIITALESISLPSLASSYHETCSSRGLEAEGESDATYLPRHGSKFISGGSSSLLLLLLKLFPLIFQFINAVTATKLHVEDISTNLLQAS
jgi:hypothetical protein